MINDRIMSTKYFNVFVLGAGASVEYGLPLWCELSELFVEEIKKNRASVVSPDLSYRFLEELEEIGTGKKYSSVDEMISKFSSETGNFPATIRWLFEVVKRIFQSRVRTENVGWIETFVDKNNLEILLNNEASNSPSMFINFNYDTLLVLKIVQFFNNDYSSTLNPDKAEWYKTRGLDFERKYEYCVKDVFHPHGVLYLFDRDEIKIGEKTFCCPTTSTFVNAQTPVNTLRVSSTRTGEDNAISCHDAKEHFTFADIKKRINNLAGRGQESSEMRLILLGVGPDSLAFNLDKIFGEEAFDVRQVHYTCTKEDDKHIYERYFNMFQATSQRYQNCQELVEKNTFIPFN